MSARKQTRTSRRYRARRSYQRTRRAAVPHRRQLTRLFEWLLPSERIFSTLQRHGNRKWTPRTMVWLALCWAWGESRNVTDAFGVALDQCRALGLGAPLSTYQGFMSALANWSDRLMQLLWPVLHQRMQQFGSGFWEIYGWVPIAFDGSRSSAPRTESNEQKLCAANYGQGKTAKYRKKKTKGMRRRKNEKNPPQPPAPQAWVTLLWHMGLRLPWMWRLGPSNSSERAHVMQMLSEGEFPKNTLFCGDAGFIGYPLWSLIRSCGYHFLIRVGANVSLLSETADCRIGKGGEVLCWPKAVMYAGLPPLRLRLVPVRIGKERMWMLTSVIPSSQLTREQIVCLYKMRWGVEVEFRGLKQTLDRSKLRCRNPRRVLAELNWSIMAMTVAELFALKEQIPPPGVTSDSGAVGDPKKRSLAGTMRALRWCLSHPHELPAPGKDLPTRLRRAITDSYIRKRPKQARYRPWNPDKKPMGDPEIRKLSVLQKKKQKLIQNAA